MKKNIYIVIAILLVLAFARFIINLNTEVELNRLEDQTTIQKIEIKEKRLNEIQTELEKKDANLEKLDKENEQLQDEIEGLKADLSAKRAREAQEAQNAIYAAEQPVQPQTAPVASVSGSCEDWMVQAGVTDMVNARELIQRESGCNPNAVNPSSGACGIGQQLPCGKWAHQWNDPVGGIKDMQGYVMSRYGSWSSAVAWHNSHNWY